MLEFTGERYIPTLDHSHISYEHWHRYFYATKFVKNKNVLDVACGEGYGSALLAKHAAKVVGIDISDAAIKHAKNKYNMENLDFRVGSVGEIPISGNGIFDVVTSFETIEHVTEENQKNFLREVKRLLKPDGIFIVSTPNKSVYSEQPNYKNEFHIKEFYKDEFEIFLKKHFSRVVFKGQKIYPVSYIWDLKSVNENYIEYGLHYEGKFYEPRDEAKSPLYLIALCSNEDLAMAKNSILVDFSNMLEKNARSIVLDKEQVIDNLHDELAKARCELEVTINQAKQLENEIFATRKTLSWRITAPLRSFKKFLMLLFKQR